MPIQPNDTLTALPVPAAGPAAAPVVIEGTLDGLEQAWCALYRAQPASPFLSWPWQRALHATCLGGQRLQVVAPVAAGRPWAAASFGRGKRRAVRCLPVRTVCMNESGDPVLDRLLLEHNRPLCRPGDEAKALGALARHLLTRRPRWDELSLGWMDEDVWRSMEPGVAGLPLTVVERGRAPYYFVDVEEGGLDGYLARLSSNTRYQIRRALRMYGGAEAVSWSVAETPELALTWFRDLVRLHQAYWNAKGRPGAFHHPRIREFHTRLISDPRAREVVEMVRVEAADGPVGYLYNLRAGRNVFNYQSGFDYAGDPRRKPGLVCHALSVAEYGRRGVRRYDLLMGDSRYKRSLATGSGQMVRIALQRHRLRFVVERAGRWMRGF